MQRRGQAPFGFQDAPVPGSRAGFETGVEVDERRDPEGDVRTKLGPCGIQPVAFGQDIGEDRDQRVSRRFAGREIADRRCQRPVVGSVVAVDPRRRGFAVQGVQAPAALGGPGIQALGVPHPLEGLFQGRTIRSK